MPHVISTDGTEIAFENTGQGSVVILVDGALSYRGYRGGRPLAAKLSEQFSVVSYDRRGRGESSDTKPYSIEREIEDIEALIGALGAPVGLYGFSSGAVLALRAAAALGPQVAKLAVLEPPFNPDDAQSKQDSLRYGESMRELLDRGSFAEAVEFFFADMLPPDVLEDVKRSSDWRTMTAVAPTLAYDNALLGDGAVPKHVARAVQSPVLVLVGGESPAFKHTAAEALERSLARAERRTIPDHSTLVPPEVLAPILSKFFG